MNYDEYIAILSGDTSLLEKSRLERQIAQLKSEEQTFYNRINNREQFIGEIKDRIDKNSVIIEKVTKDKEKYEAIPKDEKGEIIYEIKLLDTKIGKEGEILITNDLVTYNNPKDAGIALNALAEVQNKDNINITPVGYFGDFQIGIKANPTLALGQEIFENKFYILNEDTRVVYTHNNGSMPRTSELAGTFFEKALSKIDDLLSKHQEQGKQYKQELNGLLATTNSRFPKENELRKLESELNNLNIEIGKKLESKKDNKVEYGLN